MAVFRPSPRSVTSDSLGVLPLKNYFLKAPQVIPMYIQVENLCSRGKSVVKPRVIKCNNVLNIGFGISGIDRAQS